MVQLTKRSSIYGAVILLVLILVVIALLFIRFGRAYESNISTFIPPVVREQDISTRTKKTVKRVTLKEEGKEECLVLTPDGAVRQYSVCEKTLSGGQRISNSQALWRFFDRLSELTEDQYQTKGSGNVYVLTVETDTGTETYYVSLDGTGSTPVPGDLATLVDQILGDIPQPSPTGTAITATVAQSPVPSRTPTPLPPGVPSPTPTPQASAQQPFTCDFAEGSGTRPARISGVACTSEPN